MVQLRKDIAVTKFGAEHGTARYQFRGYEILISCMVCQGTPFLIMTRGSVGTLIYLF
jgi:hypothetical protein